MLLVYVTQTSGRLGLTTVLPSNYSMPEDSDLFHRPVGQHNNLQETIMHFWLRMAAIIREGNSNIFANKAFTRDLIKNGDYQQAITRMSEPLTRWRHDFDKCAAIPKYMRFILLIEYEYCRVYINALALQAVAERCANEQPSEIFGEPAAEV
ncbi:zinc finger transcriptional activator, partial [Friedmanniomyces endolithicus]